MAKQTKAITEPLELILKATPAVLSPVIKTVVYEFESEEGLGYSLEEEPESSTDNYRKLLVIALEIIENSIASADAIGIITLQSLASNQTLFRIPPRGHWYFTSEAKSLLRDSKIKGHVSNDEFNLYWDETHFTKVLERLVSEFYRLGFLDLKTDKEPLGYKLPKKERSS